MATNTETEIERQTRRYWYEDGFSEIALGGLFGAMGVLLAIDALSTAGSLPGPLRVVAPVLLVLVVLLGATAMRAGIRATKERVTYPRTGYVAYRRPATGRRVVGVAAVLVVGVVAAAVMAGGGASTRVVAVQALTLAGALLVPAWRFGLGRFYALAAAVTAAGCLAEVLPLADTARSAVLYGGAGGALIVSGAWTLRTYLRQTGMPGR